MLRGVKLPLICIPSIPPCNRFLIKEKALYLLQRALLSSPVYAVINHFFKLLGYLLVYLLLLGYLLVYFLSVFLR